MRGRPFWGYTCVVLPLLRCGILVIFLDSLPGTLLRRESDKKVCVYVGERERGNREREIVSVCVCVCLRDRERLYVCVFERKRERQCVYVNKCV